MKIVVLAAAAMVFALAAQSRVGARLDVRVEFDKAFAFAAVRTWSWHPARRGDVKMARTADDDPERMRQKAEPWIVSAVEAAMARLEIEHVEDGGDLAITYYLLLSTSFSSQTMGQFLPSVPEWGLPPFPPATQSLKFMNRGSLVLDLSAAGAVVWRGLAQTNLQPDTGDNKRETVLREAVRDLLRRYPRRK